ncbi:hypothetical protein Z042_13040 [Chania multitudinisentens RB-25]|uniref:DUF2877 domain-containing protein n=1 Tax=Chania multitudinisentens RB-25 TaxID=1441930 RepID=W0LDI7_9GAMM|nr:DUF2877 domain-containing protein [Chania multitudinisentens]AHG20449.1 hypothetical protein Z042_13040 [Chania multitudinisentens RB-25]
MMVTTFSSLSVGYLAASRLEDQDELQVHSCFQHSLNLRHPDGYLLSILHHDSQNLPDAIRIRVPGHWDWRYRAQVGQRATFALGLLHGEGWSIALAPAACWCPIRWREASPAPTMQSALSHYATLAWQLEQYCRQHRIESDLQLLPGLAANAVSPGRPPRRVQLGITDPLHLLTAEVSALIGYGRGLTPDGDDYLLGYLAALWLWRQHPTIAAHNATLRSLIGSQLSRTNDISRHYLARALEGHFSQPICDLMLLLSAEAAATQIQAAALQVMQFGASSGVDCLAGLLHGLRTLESTL